MKPPGSQLAAQITAALATLAIPADPQPGVAALARAATRLQPGGNTSG